MENIVRTFNHLGFLLNAIKMIKYLDLVPYLGINWLICVEFLSICIIILYFNLIY